MSRPIKALIAVLAFWPAVLLGASEIKIFTTLPVFSMIAQDIGGDHIQVTCLTQGRDDPHHILVTPSQSRALEQADFVISSQDLSSQLPVAAEKCLHVGVLPQKPSPNLRKRRSTLAHWLGGHQHCHKHDHGDCHHHHHHGKGLFQAQHEWLCCTSMQVVAEVIADALIHFDPENAVEYHKRMYEVIKQLEFLKHQYQSLPAPQPYVIYHEEFFLLQKEMAVNFGPVLYLCHQQTLSPKRLKDILVEGEYQALLVPPSLDEGARAQLESVTTIPIKELDTSGANAAKGTTYAQFLSGVLAQLYNIESEH